jgi:hypothetical protein
MTASQIPLTPEFKRIRDKTEQELFKLGENATVDKTMRDGRVIRFRRFGLSWVVGYHQISPPTKGKAAAKPEYLTQLEQLLKD